MQLLYNVCSIPGFLRSNPGRELGLGNTDPPISLYSLPQLIPSQIFLCNILIKNLRSGIERMARKGNQTQTRDWEKL